MSLAPEARIGAYEVVALIGVGGMGEVYRALDTNLGRQVAIKVLPDSVAHDPERLARFEREAKTLASLNHPNIAIIHGLEKADGIRALVMDVVEGPTLADRIAQGPIPLDEALPIARQIAEALEAAHEQGMFVLPPDQRDPVTAVEMLNILQFGELEIHQAEATFTADGVEYPKGSYVITMAQLFGSFAKTLLEKQEYPDLREYPGGPPQRPYDVVAHTLPIQMGVKVVTISRPFDAKLARIDTIVAAPGVVERGPANTYLLGHESNASIKALNRLLKEGADVFWTARPITLKGKTYPAGTLMVPASPGVHTKLQSIARDNSVDFVAAPERPGVIAWKLRAPRVALYKSYAASMDEGWARFIFEDYGLPFANVLDKDIRAGRLRAKYDVIVIPGEISEVDIIQGRSRESTPAEYAGGIGEDGVQNLRDFVNDGGTLITMDEATEFAARRFSLPMKNLLDRVRPQDFYVPGSLLRVVLDVEHPIAYGLPREAAVFFQQNAAYEVTGAARAVAQYPLTNPLLSGWILGEERLHGKTAVADIPVGSGRVVLLSIRPQFRAQMRSTYKLLFNSIYYGAATQTTY